MTSNRSTGFTTQQYCISPLLCRHLTREFASSVVEKSKQFINIIDASRASLPIRSQANNWCYKNVCIEYMPKNLVLRKKKSLETSSRNKGHICYTSGKPPPLYSRDYHTTPCIEHIKSFSYAVWLPKFKIHLTIHWFRKFAQSSVPCSVTSEREKENQIYSPYHGLPGLPLSTPAL